MDAPTKALTEELAAKLWVYGYPLVYGLDEMQAYVAGTTQFPMAAPVNSFGHARHLAGPDMAFVSPNNDTLYSVAVCDVRGGPLRLRVPDTGGRYYVLQFIDAWTNNFAYIGRRSTGTAAGEFVLAAEGADVGGADETRVVRAPTGVFVIAGRLQVDSDAELPAIHALQDQFVLEPLGDMAPTPGMPQPDPGVAGDLAWWERFRVALQAFPPPAADAAVVEQAALAGLLQATSPFVDPDPSLAGLLAAGAEAGRAQIEVLMQGVAPTPTGWNLATHIFDYNLDHFGIGTVDSPEWRIPDRNTAYEIRAVAARGGLWGNHGYEAAYATVWVDDQGQPLVGEHRYELRLPSPPPVDAFWSLTMYDVPKFYLVANPINRYSIGDRTPGLRYDPDGGVTIHIQTESPGPDHEANWLPTPPGPFRPLLRLYQPGAEFLDGSYTLPAVVRVD